MNNLPLIAEDAFVFLIIVVLVVMAIRGIVREVKGIWERWRPHCLQCYREGGEDLELFKLRKGFSLCRRCIQRNHEALH